MSVRANNALRPGRPPLATASSSTAGQNPRVAKAFANSHCGREHCHSTVPVASSFAAGIVAGLEGSVPAEFASTYALMPSKPPSTYCRSGCRHLGDALNDRKTPSTTSISA
eukprot:5368807-Amphidinium_carterae.1